MKRDRADEINEKIEKEASEEGRKEKKILSSSGEKRAEMGERERERETLSPLNAEQKSKITSRLIERIVLFWGGTRDVGQTDLLLSALIM